LRETTTWKHGSLRDLQQSGEKRKNVLAETKPLRILRKREIASGYARGGPRSVCEEKPALVNVTEAK
jgi:hypothetical protein